MTTTALIHRNLHKHVMRQPSVALSPSEIACQRQNTCSGRDFRSVLARYFQVFRQELSWCRDTVYVLNGFFITRFSFGRPNRSVARADFYLESYVDFPLQLYGAIRIRRWNKTARNIITDTCYEYSCLSRESRLCPDNVTGQDRLADAKNYINYNVTTNRKSMSVSARILPPQVLHFRC
jgi:hypothetical protein